MSEKVCTACMFCKQSDFGYSNYTVEGTSVDCLWNANPKFPTDDSSEDKQAEASAYAEQCEFYREGTGLYFDCDRECEQSEIRDWIQIHIKEAK